MADDERPGDGTDDGPSIAPPSFSLRRRRRPKPSPQPEQEPQPVVVENEPEPVVVENEPEPVVVENEPEPVVLEPEPEPEPQPSLVPGFDAEPTRTLPVAPEPVPAPAPRAVEAPQPAKPAKPPKPARAPREPRKPRPPLDVPPWFAGPLAALLIGAAVGLTIVVLTALARAGCGLVRGTDTCGGGPGFVLLLAVLAVGVLLGASLLRFARVDGPTSTSLLAVGLLAVVVMVFLLGSVEAWWMAVVVPVLTALTYAASTWLSVAVKDVGTDD